MKTGYTQQQKELNKNLRGVSEWEEYFLQPLRETYETGVGQIQAASNYDISSAYANYKKQQLQLAQQNAFSEGVMKKLEKQLESEYASNVYSTQTTAAENLATLQSEIDKKYTENQEALEARSQIASDLTAAVAEYLGYSDEQLLSGIGVNIGTEEEPLYGKGWYSLDEEGNRVQTAVSIDELSKVLLSSDFANNLKETNPKLYEQYIENPALFNQLLGVDKNRATYDMFDWSSRDARVKAVQQAYSSGDITRGFDSLFEDFNNNKISSKQLSTAIIETLSLLSANSLSTAERQEIEDWANNISKGKNKTFVDKDRQLLKELLENFKPNEYDWAKESYRQQAEKAGYISGYYRKD
jgi:hypothetical protein